MKLRPCLDCGKVFTAGPRKSRCPECQRVKNRPRNRINEAKRRESQPWKAKQYRGDWQRARASALAYYGRYCRVCFTDQGLTVHHRVPLRDGGGNDIANLEVLCRRCHGSQHKHDPKKPNP